MGIDADGHSARGNVMKLLLLSVITVMCLTLPTNAIVDTRVSPLEFIIVFTDQFSLSLIKVRSPNVFSRGTIEMGIWDLAPPVSLVDSARIELEGAGNREIRASIVGIELSFDKRDYWIKRSVEGESLHGLYCGIIRQGNKRVIGCPISSGASANSSEMVNRAAWLAERFARMRFQLRDSASPADREVLYEILKSLRPGSEVVLPFRAGGVITQDGFDAGRYISDAIDQILSTTER